MKNKVYFTFGQDHMTSYPLSNGGKIADYWVTVSLMPGNWKHREVFVEYFTSYHCPRPMQFAMEYSEKTFKPDYFPGGELCVITENGIQ